MAKITFRSHYDSYRVFFDPRHYGSIETSVPLTDANGHAVLDGGGKMVMRREAVPVAKFEHGMLVLDDENPIQARQIEALRTYIERRTEERKLPPGECQEEDPRLTNAVDVAAGAVLVAVPDEMTQEGLDLLHGTAKGPGLLTYFHNPIPAPALSGAFDLLDRALAYFEVQGIVSPTKERAKKLLRPRIIELVYALQDAGVPMEKPGAPEAEKKSA